MSSLSVYRKAGPNPGAEDEVYAARLARAREIVQANASRSVVFWSGGRDSTALLRLCLDENPDIPVCFVDSGVEFPETLRFVESLATAWRLSHFTTLVPRYAFWSLPESPVPGHPRCVHWLRVEPSLRFMSQHAIPTELLGDRMGEHPTRRRAPADTDVGPGSQLPAVYPLWGWSRENVVRFHDERSIPVNTLYALGWSETPGCLPCPYRNRLRVMERTHPAFFSQLLTSSTADDAADLEGWIRSRLD